MIWIWSKRHTDRNSSLSTSSSLEMGSLNSSSRDNWVQRSILIIRNEFIEESLFQINWVLFVWKGLTICFSSFKTSGKQFFYVNWVEFFWKEPMTNPSSRQKISTVKTKFVPRLVTVTLLIQSDLILIIPVLEIEFSILLKFTQSPDFAVYFSFNWDLILHFTQDLIKINF